MTADYLHPTGRHLVEHWTATDDSDLALIAVPDSPLPLVLSWRRYTHPEADGDHFLGVFRHGECALVVRERYEQLQVTDDGYFRRHFRYRSADGVCCTELVEELAAGRELELTRVESGAYRGLWRAEVHRAGEIEIEGEDEDDSEDGSMELACRAVFNLKRKTVSLFRWSYIDISG